MIQPKKTLKSRALKYLWFNDIPLVITGIGINTLITMGVYYRDSLFVVPFRLWILKYLGFSLGIGILWLIVRELYILLIKRFPGYSNNKKRWLRLPGIYILFAFLLLFAAGYVRPIINVEFPGYDDPHIGLEYLMGTLMFLVNIYLYESFHLFAEIKNLKIQASEIQKERVTSQLLQLKHQISPHFLFNSLNTLIYLIDTDTKKSKEFVHGLSNIYGRVLEFSDKDLVTLKEEVDYVRTYIDLLKKRFGENLKVHLNITQGTMHKMIVPLSIQTGVENAVKHNIVSKNKPLQIEILTTNDFLIVKNNLQKKETVHNTNGQGLKNIRNRYKLISTLNMETEESSTWFTLKLPLLDV